jgi:hypothetical protein
VPGMLRPGRPRESADSCRAVDEGPVGHAVAVGDVGGGQRQGARAPSLTRWRPKPSLSWTARSSGRSQVGPYRWAVSESMPLVGAAGVTQVPTTALRSRWFMCAAPVSGVLAWTWAYSCPDRSPIAWTISSVAARRAWAGRISGWDRAQ